MSHARYSRDPLGGPIHPQRLTEWFGRHPKAASVTTGTLHILRHTHATLALTNGVPLHVVAARLGDRPKTIPRAYGHLLPHSDVEAAKQFAATVSTRLAIRALTRVARRRT